MMGLFKAYGTNKNLETSGISYTPDSSTLITLARAGGSNVKFAKVLDKKAKPFRRQIEAGTLDPELDKRMMAETYAESIIVNWETLVAENLVQGLEADPDAGPDVYSSPVDENGLVPFNKQNVVATLLALPDLFLDIQKEAQRVANFLNADKKDEAKN